MGVMLSVATSADGYIDDCTAQRLILSPPEDWAEVYALRAAADAIVIGAQTLRSDNPRLSLKSERLVAARMARGLAPEPHKVIISSDGRIDPALRIFSSPLKNIIIFSTIPRPELLDLAEVIVCEVVTPELVVTELESRGLSNIFVEGGAKIHSMFLESLCVDSIRVAVNPAIVVGDAAAPRFELPDHIASLSADHSNLGGMLVAQYRLKESREEQDQKLMARAIELSRNCRPSATSYCVGAVIITATCETFEGYTHETSPTHHAEQEALLKAQAAGVDLCGATMYSSMEPCSQRASEPESCSALIIRHGFARAVFALYEPSCFVCCKGALNMRHAGLEVSCMPSFAHAVREVNSHLNF